jgi:hypothetical protein
LLIAFYPLFDITSANPNICDGIGKLAAQLKRKWLWQHIVEKIRSIYEELSICAEQCRSMAR